MTTTAPTATARTTTPLTTAARITSTVLIPTRNRAEPIAALLRLLLQDSATTQIVVVDDASTDDTGRMLAEIAADEPRLLVVPGPGRGAFRARLAGAAVATGDVLIILDDDVVPEPGLVTGHLRHHVTADGAPSRTAVLGYMPTHVPEQRGPDTFTTHLYAHEYEGRCATYDTDADSILTHFWTGNVSLPREAFIATSSRHLQALPDNRHEDQVMGLRLRDHGLDAVFDRSLKVIHQHQRTLGQFRRDSVQDGAGMAAVDRLDPACGYGGSFAAGLPLLLRLAVKAARLNPVYVILGTALEAAVRRAGAARAWAAQENLAKTLRRLDQQHGYRCAAAAH